MLFGMVLVSMILRYNITFIVGETFFVFNYLWVLDGTAGNDFEVEEEGHFSIIFYFIFTSNKLYKY